MANLRTGKLALARGYAPRTINHCLSAVYGFSAFHEHFGRGPVVNPVPSSRARRLALAHHSPIEAKRQFKRARLRQRVADATPRAIPDAMWDELFAVMTCDRDRALLLCYVSSGARASELLGVAIGDVDWAGARGYVVSKGTRLRQAVPVSPEAIRYLTRYLDADRIPGPDEPLWRTRRGQSQPGVVVGDAAGSPPVLGRRGRADSNFPVEELLLRQWRVQHEAVTGRAERRGRTGMARQRLDAFPCPRAGPVHSPSVRTSNNGISVRPPPCCLKKEPRSSGQVIR